MAVLKWDKGDEGCFEAESSMQDDGEGFTWRISLCDDGTFCVCESDKELTDNKKTFETFREAVAFCQAIENYLAEYKEQILSWQPIQTAPKDRRIICWREDMKYPCSMCWAPGRNSYISDDGQNKTPTHWIDIKTPGDLLK